jgi:hypothetical protein
MNTDEHRGDAQAVDEALSGDHFPRSDDRGPATNDQRPTTSPVALPRRAFLRHAAGLGCALAGTGAVGALFHHLEHDTVDAPASGTPRVFDTRVPPEADAPVLATVHGPDAAEAVRRAVDALGGMGRFVKSGETVLVKPNVGWDRLPVHGANTNPEVVAAVVRLCREAGASRVVVTDVSCNEPRRCFERSGIWRAAEDAGAEVVLPTDGLFEEVELGEGLGR